MQIATLEREILAQDSYRPLGISSEVYLTEEQFDSLSRLERFEAPYLEEKLLKEGEFSSSQEYKGAFGEFKRYVALVDLNRGKDVMSMTSKGVDEVWHQFILFTPQYHDFCDEMLGRYLHHVPKTSHTPSNPTGTKNFIKFYQEAFGYIPSIWGSSEDCGEPPGGCSSGDCSQPDDYPIKLI